MSGGVFGIWQWFILGSILLLIFYRKSIFSSLSSTQSKLENDNPNFDISTLSYKNIEECLVNEEGWNQNEIGPSGQTFRIDLGNNNTPSLFLHELVKMKTGGSRITPISNLIKPNRFIKFSGEGIKTEGFTGYDEMDRITWKSNLTERLASSQNIDDILDKDLLILRTINMGFGFIAKDLKKIVSLNLAI